MLFCLAVLSLTLLPQHYLTIHVTDGTTVQAEGEVLENTAYPFVVLVNIGNKSCSGTVLNDSWVLTLIDCAKGTSEEPVWVSDTTNSYENNIERLKDEMNHAAKLHWGPTASRLLLLELEKPLQHGRITSNLTFSKYDKLTDFTEPCKVTSFDTSSSPLRTFQARMLHGDECVTNLDTTTPTNKERLAGFNGNPESSRNNTGDQLLTDVMKKSTHKDESKKGELGRSVLCSNVPGDGKLLLGSPVVCQGVVVAMATGKSQAKSTCREVEKLQSYYALLQPQDKWIQKTLPWIHVSSANGTTGDELITDEECKLKSLLRLRRMSQIIFPWWTSLLMPHSSEYKGSKHAKLASDEEKASPNAIYQSFSWWLPLESTVRANLWRYDFDDQPNFEFRTHPLEPQESLRISNYVKKSATRQNSSDRTLFPTTREIRSTTLRPLKRVKRKAFKPEFNSKKTAVLPETLLRKLRNAGQRDTRSVLSLRKSAGLPSWRKVRYPPEFKK